MWHIEASRVQGRDDRAHCRWTAVLTAAIALVGFACSDAGDATSDTAESTSTSTAPAPDRLGALSFEVDELSDVFDVRIDAERCAVVERQCDGPATVSLVLKGEEEPFQRIDVPRMYIETGADREQPEIESDGLYGSHVPVLILRDVTFDGLDDLAIRNGNDGAYGGPSYDVHVARQADPVRFELHQALTDLASNGLAFPDVDPTTKRLHVLTKDGCCQHIDTAYEIRDGQPVQVDQRRKEDTATLGVVWAPAQRGWGTVRPREIDNGGNPTGIAFDLTWESWGGPTAIGRGQTYIVPSGPGHVTASAVPGPVTVVAYDLGDCHGRLAYRKAQWLIRDQEFDRNRGSDHDICPNEPFVPFDPITDDTSSMGEAP